MKQHKFKTTNIKGKQYVEVNERIKFFRQENQYKNWGIHTEFPMLDSEQALCKCTIVTDDGVVVAQGHAHEVKSSSNINKTSYVETAKHLQSVGRWEYSESESTRLLRQLMKSRKPLPSNKRWLITPTFKSCPKSSMPLSKISWTKQSDTSRPRLISAKLSMPSLRSTEAS